MTKCVRFAMTKNFLKEYVEECITEVLRNFDLNFFKNLKGNLQKIDYAQKILPFIGAGSARIVFAVSGDKVLKVAKNKKGLAQNNAEIEMFLEMDAAGFGNVLTKIYDYDKSGAWVLSEIASPLRDMSSDMSKFTRYVGVPFSLYRQIIFNMDDAGVRSAVSQVELAYDEGTPEAFLLDEIILRPKEFHFIYGVAHAINNLDLMYGDLLRPGQYGRTTDGRIVLLDYGFTEIVHLMHYKQ